MTLSGSGKSNNDNGRIVKYEWDFENDAQWDNSSTTTGKTTHIYNVTGNYTAMLRVTDEAGQWACDVTNVTIKPKPNIAPVAKAGDDRTAFAGTEVQFCGTGEDSDGVIVKYMWDFDGDLKWDHINSSSGNCSHFYNSTGEFCAVLTVIDNGGANGSDSCIIHVNLNNPPRASAGMNQVVECGSTVLFDGSGSEDPEGQSINFSWDFDAGDGIQPDAEKAQAYHSYDRGGVYTATLTVVDALGASSNDTVVIRVNQRAAVSLNPSPIILHLKPGVEGISVITLFNNGNGLDSFALSLIGGQASWGALDRTCVTLGAGAYVAFPLWVRPPENSTVATPANIIVQAVSALDPGMVAITSVTVIVDQVHNFSVSTSTARLVVRAGKSATFSLNITNMGNGDETVRLLIGGNASYMAIVSPYYIVPCGARYEVKVGLEVPIDEYPKDYELSIIAIGGENSSASPVVVNIIVKEGAAASSERNFSVTIIVGTILSLLFLIASRWPRSKKKQPVRS